MKTVREELDSMVRDIWNVGLDSILDSPATTANLADFARLPLEVLAWRQSNRNVLWLNAEVRAMADVANLAPDPR